MLDGPLSATALVPALVLTPLSLTRQMAPRAAPPAAVACAGAVAIALNVAVPVSLHIAQIPIAPTTLAVTHWSIALLSLTLLRLRHLPPIPHSPRSRSLAAMAALYALAVLPVTYLAGQDTYKWQDLASAVSLEGTIPWLAHPLALFGLTPRAYPSAQPLLLATVELLGHVGIDWGFYIVSVFTGLFALCAFHVLTQRLASSPHPIATLAPALYVFSPVFLRYGYWATGRGLFLAVYPLYLAALLDLPRPKAVAGVLATGLLVCLCHKIGIFACVIPLVLMPAARFAPRRPPPPLAAGLGLALLALAGAALAPRAFTGGVAGHVLGFVRASLVRFGWMLPAAAVALLARPEWFATPARRRLLPSLLLTYPLAYSADMYGALIALPFLTLAACDGLEWLIRRNPTHTRAVTGLTLAATALLALATLANRAATATPPRIREAARFLEQTDPAGPYMIGAPGRARSQLQGYVTGCPRFRIVTGDNARLRVEPATAVHPPPIFGPPAGVYRDWERYVRSLLVLDDAQTEWYGDARTVYDVRIDGQGPPPTPAPPIYHQNGIEIRQRRIP